MTAADLHALAELLERLEAAGFEVALQLGGGLTITARLSDVRGEPFADGTRFTDRTGWVEAPKD